MAIGTAAGGGDRISDQPLVAEQIKARPQGRASLLGQSGSKEPLLFEGSRYFFTQAFFASSHFMSFVFSQSAFVFGASAANAGAATASKRPVMMAVFKILADIGVFLLRFGHPSYDHASKILDRFLGNAVAVLPSLALVLP